MKDKVTKSKEKKYATYQKRVRANGIEETVDVEEIDNGFIVTYCKYDCDNWKELSKKKLFTPKNPLGEDDKVEDEVTSLITALDKLDLGYKKS